MDLVFEAARILTIAAFLGYGAGCMRSAHMAAEFERYGLARWRLWVGGLEIAGALGLLAGYWLPPLTPAAAAGLSVLMGLGLLTRVRIRDPWVSMVPAAVFLVLNLFILGYATRVGPSDAPARPASRIHVPTPSATPTTASAVPARRLVSRGLPCPPFVSSSRS